MRVIGGVSVALCAAILAGCTPATFQEKLSNYVGNKPDLDGTDVTAYVTNQNKVMEEFAKLAGVNPAAGGEWRQVIDAGIHYVDVRCDRFMDSLFWFNRARETSSRQIQYTGAALGAALAVLEASKNAIGLTPLGFSLFDQTVNNLGAGLLFSLNPSTVRVLVEKKQEAYVRSLSPSYTNKAIALQVIQNYAAICLPPSIETEVERAIANEGYKPDSIVPKLPPAFDDVTPDPFTFPSVADAAPGTLVESAPIRVTGIGGSARISVSAGGKYRIGARDWTPAEGMVGPNEAVRVQVKSSDTPGAAASATLDIGGVAGSFTVTTRGAAVEGTGPVSPETQPVVSSGTQLPPAPPVTITPEQNALPSPQPN